MKLEDFRNPELAKKLVGAINQAMPSGRFTVMEVCGGQTHTIYKYRLRELLPKNLRLISGPGCPVCVTPINYIDKAISLALDHGCTIYTFGDLMRVPGTTMSLERAAAEGGDIRAVYSPLQAMEAAAEAPEQETVFLGIGFETTMPPVVLSIVKAAQKGLTNFSVLLSGKRVPPVLDAVLQSPKINVDGFITPGHVTAVIGTAPYAPLCEKYQVPMAVGGFEPLDLLAAVLNLAQQFAAGTHENANAYTRAVPSIESRRSGAKADGNPKAQALMDDVLEVADDELRGLGVLPQAGFAIRSTYATFDANKRFEIKTDSHEPEGCACGEVLCGVIEPEECPLFRTVCNPDSPIGSCMVSAEGACNAAYLFG
ncbi:MAG: hydrogenase formation protein HypD [Kiritimatiellales bacterium]|nr:hydrogenase formation protein HypD [Kiritimatiellota bacterium]MBL7012317.1 hydrogenase formation protein HypD [Kiritimatiellales bacterium]